LSDREFLSAIHATNPTWIATAIQPGMVDTDMGRQGSAALGVGPPPTSVGESVEKILKFVSFPFLSRDCFAFALIEMGYAGSFGFLLSATMIFERGAFLCL
jgi:hypothetical protein